MRLRDFWPDIERPGGYDTRAKTILMGVFLGLGFVIGCVFYSFMSKLGC